MHPERIELDEHGVADDRRYTLLTDDGRIFVLGVRGGDGLGIKLQELHCDGDVAWEWNHESPGWNTAFSGGLAWSSELGLVVGGSDFLSMSDQRGYLARIPF